jgi:hypothetical protein
MLKKRSILRAFMVCSLTISTGVSAATQVLSGNGLTLTYNDANCGLGVSASDCNTMMQNAFNNSSQQFQLGVLKDYLKYMSSAQSLTTKGHGVDYTTNPSLLVVGATGGAGVDIGGKSLSEAEASIKTSGSIPAVGSAFQFSIMAGLNLGYLKTLPEFGPIDLKRLTVYVHAGGFNFSSLLAQDGLTVKSSQFGFHGKYKLIQPKSVGFGTLNWGGLDFISGFTVASNTLDYQKTFDQQSSGSGTAASPKISITPAGAITVTNTAIAIPFEIATSVRLLYILSLFGGAGIDLNFGKSTVDMNLASTSISSTVNGNTAALNDANMKVSASESSAGRFGDVRFFAGTAVNFIPLKNTNVLSWIVQGNISTGGGYGVLTGVRAGW